jgi:peptidoglycan/LPS O-acetylase OafA/YrhL
VDYLDGLRGLACMLVVSLHIYTNLPWHFVLPVPGVRIDLSHPEYLGYTGVNLFLVLSGICLFLPVVRRGGTLNARDFAIRRCWRILPPYYAALLLVIAYAWVVLGNHRISSYAMPLFMHVLFIHNFFFQYVQAIIKQAWTLALEAQWYVAFPLLVIAYRVFPPRLVLLSTLALSLAFRAISIPLYHPGLNLNVYFCVTGSLPSRIFEFALGMFIAGNLANRASEGYRLSRWDWFWVAAAAAQILWNYPTGWKIVPRAWPFTDAAYGILFASLTLLAANKATIAHRILTNKLAVWIGTVSYSIYLTHLFVLGILIPRFAHHFGYHANFFAWFVLAPACVIFGWLFFLAFEQPALNKLKVLRAAHRQAPALAAAEEAADLTATP